MGPGLREGLADNPRDPAGCDLPVGTEKGMRAIENHSPGARVGLQQRDHSEQLQ